MAYAVWLRRQAASEVGTETARLDSSYGVRHFLLFPVHPARVRYCLELHVLND